MEFEIKPEICSRGSMILAGVQGAGEETGSVWESYMKLEKVCPLANTVDKAGYEVRLYPGGTGPGNVFVGMSVKSRDVPSEYQLMMLPSSLYAEFEIYPSKGYGSSNETIEKWLYENSERYQQRMLEGNSCGIEVYDERFKGSGNPDSVVGMLVPLEEIGSQVF
ncbi:MAG: GyrI-like domain-containing protein [Dehalococcoidales bacterium]|nr:GyrI-like domain-containing protein [Dehalococcoidales bacterium]